MSVATHCIVDGKPLTEHEKNIACDPRGGNRLYCDIDGVLLAKHPKCAGCTIFFGNSHTESGPVDNSPFCPYCFQAQANGHIPPKRRSRPKRKVSKV